MRASLVLGLLLAPAVALAQQTMEPPAIVEYVEAEYPPAAAAIGLEADVVLSLDIDAEGRVVGATVVEPAGHGFDEAAVDAVRRFVFSPARRGGEPIPSRVTFTYGFRLPEPEPVPEHATGDVRGWVIDEGGMSVAGAHLRITGPIEVEVETDADGAFVVTDLPAGEYDVSIDAEGFEPFAVRETVVANEELTVRYHARFVRGDYETVVRAPPPDREVSRRTLDSDEIRRVPGTGGDALRAVESQPGVGRPPLGLGLFVIRGSPPDDTLVLLEEHPVPLPYHLGGLATVVASDLVDRVEYQPGSFGPRYGRTAGGVIEVRLRTPRRDRVHVAADVDLIDAGAVAEMPVGSRAALALGFRRSYVDALFPLFVPDDIDLSFTQAPRYMDYQALLDWEPGRDDRVRLLASGSDDALGLFFESPSEDDPGLRGAVTTHLTHHAVQARWSRELGGGAVHEISPGLVYSLTEVGVGPSIDMRFESLILGLRDELRAPLGGGRSVTAGADFQLGALDTAVTAPPPPDQREAPDPIFGQARRHYDDQRTLVNVGAYAELELHAGARTTLLPGVRWDWHGLLDASTLDPRLRVRHRLHRRLSIVSAIGIYSQPPRGYEVIPEFGNPDLAPERGVHVMLGFEEKVARPLDLEALVFVKTLDSAAAPHEETGYASVGSGRTIGGEWLLRLRPVVPAFGWIAYTFSRTEFRDAPGDPWRLGPYDQTHILTVVLGTAIPGGWEIGTRYRMSSGYPEFPVIGADYDADFDVYRPILHPTRVVRLPAFHSLDFRIAKRFRGLGLDWRAWLDVQNVTNRANPENRVYSYDYSESTIQTGLPILPSIGIRGEY